ncbi:MAG: LPS export ABC transporter periplasmic protein LptC [Betaproteobacteria bacterium]|jgi:lipopolysaccharide export system protein LptC|nr:MAG: LPS export ABC transporter periplasmic protein LptC [Betaproteobacteria bacterium]
MIKDRLVAWSPVILLLLLAALTMWLDSRVRLPERPANAAEEKDPEFYIEGFMAIRMNPDGTRRYELTGTRLTHYADADKKRSDLASPSLLYYDYDRAPVKVSSNTAEVEDGGDNVYFRGDVTISRPAFGENPALGVATDYMHVKPDEETAETKESVTMTEGNSTVRSDGLKFDNKKRKIWLDGLDGPVRAHYETPRSRAAATQAEDR